MGIWDFFRRGANDNGARALARSLSFGSTLTVQKVERAPAKPVEDRSTVADHLDALCAEHDATYEIGREGGEVIIALTFPNHDRLSGVGASAKEALEHLKARVDARV
jgi:hypothetical protein